MLDFDLLIQLYKEAIVEQVTLCFILNYKGQVFIARRHKLDYLDGCYELPQGVMQDGESVLGASHRILKKFFNLELLSIEQFIRSFPYISAQGKKCRAFVFHVQVKDPLCLTLSRNDHGVWMTLPEMGYWPIMTQFSEAIFSFWTGEGYDKVVANTLIERAKKDSIWRFKVRVLPCREGEFILLKRARRRKQYPLYYEFPGKEFKEDQELDSVIVECVSEQTGHIPERIVRYLGYFDYVSPSRQEVREFIFAVIAQDKPITLSEHAYAIWAADLSHSSISATPSTQAACALYKRKFMSEIPQELEELPVVYHDPFSEQDGRLFDHLKALDALERQGAVDLHALREVPLRKKTIPPELHRALGL